jgi:hypothetical protein
VNEASNVKGALASVGDLIPLPTRKTNAMAEGGFRKGPFYKPLPTQFREGVQIGGRLVEPAEVYPKSEGWGLDGWTVLDKETAFRRLREIVSASQKESANPVKKSPIQNTKRCSETKKLCGDVKDRRDG